MSTRLYGFIKLSCILFMLAACNIRPIPSLIPTQTRPVITSTPATVETISPTETLPVKTPEIGTQTPDPSPELCQLGLGLRQQTTSILGSYQEHPGFVMTATVGMAEEYYPQLDGWIRTLGAPSLEALERKARRAEENGIPYEALSYGLETSESTPDEEWQDLVGSTRKAKLIAEKYGKLLVMGPGFRLMSENEDKYPVLAEIADIWMLQTQRLQIDPPGEKYRAEVERIIDLIRSGNTDMSIWGQITFPPDRVPDSSEWLAYHESIDDLVTGTYIGIYTWDSVNNDQLVMNAEEIYAQLCRDEG